MLIPHVYVRTTYVDKEREKEGERRICDVFSSLLTKCFIDFPSQVSPPLVGKSGKLELVWLVRRKDYVDVFLHTFSQK